MSKGQNWEELWETWDRLEAGCSELTENVNFRLLYSALQENGPQEDLLWIDSVAVIELGFYHGKREFAAGRLRRTLHGLIKQLKERMGKGSRDLPQNRKRKKGLLWQ